MQQLAYVAQPTDQRFELFSDHTPEGMLQTLVGGKRALRFERRVRVDRT
jgi:hypothetical protein